jgi:hypothetical protein
MTMAMNDEQLRTVKAAQYSQEYKDAAKEVMFNAAKLRNPYGI